MMEINKTTNEKHLAEESYRITTSDFGKKILWSIDPETNQGKTGEFVVEDIYPKTYFSYSVELDKCPKVIKLNFTTKPDRY